MRRVWLAMAWCALGCAPPGAEWESASTWEAFDAAGLPVEHAPAARILRLETASPQVVEGTTASLTIRGLPPFQRVFVALSTERTGLAACPTQTAPLCLAIPQPFFLVGSATASLTGVATVQVDIPAGVAPLEAVLQAVAIRGPDVYLSNTVDWDVLLPTGGEWVDLIWDGLIPLADCNTAGVVTLQGALQGQAEAAEVYLAQTRFLGGLAAWDEHHSFELLPYDPVLIGGITPVVRTLTTGASTGTQTADVSTIFRCAPGIPSLDENDPANFMVTFALASWRLGDDPAVDPPADCVVRGQDPAGLVASPAGSGRNPPDWLDGSCRLPAP